MCIAIIGAGAMGGLLGFYLSHVTEVVLIDPWAAHVAAINADGLICAVDGVDQVRSVRAVATPDHAGVADLALVLVKAHQTAWAAQVAQAILAPQGVVYTLQNGVGNREILAQVLGANRVGQAVTALGATLVGPGRVRHAGRGVTHIGAAPLPHLAHDLAALWGRAGLPAEVHADVESLVWGKLLVNVGINALSAILRVPNGALAQLPHARSLLSAAVSEAAAVATARGTTLPYPDPVAHTLAVAHATAANRSSMLQDVERHAPTEISTINGAVVREGERLGIPTPVNQVLMDLIMALEEVAV
ncbi:ketopantoate reductase family protein [Candidatus Oscillochloris fontis]|uniref:ketopantoate reductase family protein n=1 Tax=Candidatus Oscillochloris fontis TaxID=2496868 RepID=UPI00101C9F74|nr:2-dehydropantoate 2-reductase [Candidatus Oscillochloris fontis]